MKVDPRTYALIKQRLDEAERNIQYVRQALEGNGDDSKKVYGEETDLGERIVEGVFDGQNMQSND